MMQNRGNPTKKYLVALTGPTAIGKTRLAIQMARDFKTEIISADSRQFYRELQIGTAAPTAEELAAARHHFVGNLSITQSYNVSQYEKEVLAQLNELFREHRMVVLVGGSGLYIDAVCNGIDELPDPDPALRAELREMLEIQGLAALNIRLYGLDPVYYSMVDRANPKRVMRALEVCLTTGKKYSDLRKQAPKQRPFEIVKIALNMDRATLFNRINQRVDMMVNQGLVEEARQFYTSRHFNALNTVGYKELFRFFDGDITLEQAIADIKTNSRRYAKRQLTWCKRDPQYHWFSPSDYKAIHDFVKTNLMSL